MTTKLVNIKFDENILEKMDETVKNGLYHSRTEFIRESVRKNLLEFKKKQFFNDLEKLKKEMKEKGVKIKSPFLTSEQKQEILEEFLKEKKLDL